MFAACLGVADLLSVVQSHKGEKTFLRTDCNGFTKWMGVK